MTNQNVIGILLISIGVLEPVIGLLLCRKAQPKTRLIIISALAVSGLMMVGVGTAFLTGVIFSASN